MLVVLPLVAMGAVMAVATPDLAVSKGPVVFTDSLLPDWISVPYRGTYDAAAPLDITPAGAYWYTGGFAVPAAAAWGTGPAVGLLFTGVEWSSGPLAATWIGLNGLGRAATIAASGGLYALLPRPAGHKGHAPLHF
ncbi:hypothetical protein [Streptomyces atratus]|uniref:hypothetical protein n=1 Tax=Streptomyces atratus TaxID=1893 RepID=UPI0033D80A2F